MLPGKMTMKNPATSQPTMGRQHTGVAMSAKPRMSSITPNIATTASGAGIHGGTWARNSSADAKCPIPAMRSTTPSPSRAIMVIN